MILMTAHRRENWGEPMRDICVAVKKIVESNPDVTVVFPVHKNPIVRDTVYPELQGVDRVILTEPPDYVQFVHLIKQSYLILTDSGGVQEEAPSVGKPEGVDAGNAKLVGTDVNLILREAETLLHDQNAYQAMAMVKSPYGDGRAAERIWEIIRSRFSIVGQ